MQALTTFGQNLIEDHKAVFIAGGEFLSSQFAEQERKRGRPAEGYGRRPLIALRVKAGKTDMNFKPGWKESRRQDGKVIKPGVLLLDRVHIESRWDTGERLATVKMTITEDKAQLGSWRLCGRRGDTFNSQDILQERIREIAVTLRRLIHDPMTVFAEQSDRCCCCRKPLSEVTSRLRGIGPECIKYFRQTEQIAEVVRTKYRSLDDEWWSCASA